MTYKEARVYLDEVSKYGSVLGLDTIRNLLAELNNPQEDLHFIHIAGTNGKGSVLAYTSTILSEAGYRTGRYVSPTVTAYLEKIQIDGKWISEDTFAKLVEEVKAATERLAAKGEGYPTIFEIETAVAFLYFKQEKCDLVVLETGLGGLEDATNVVTNTEVAAFVSISMDHMGFLGNSLDEIATQKAGIIKPGCHVVSAAQKIEASKVLKARAEMLGCDYREVDLTKLQRGEMTVFGQTFSYEIDGKRIQDISISLVGDYQAENASLAMEVIGALRKRGYEISEDAIYQGLSHTVWPGRFTCINKKPLFIIDGAHNEDAALRLKETIEKCLEGKRLIAIMGVFKDKEYEKIAGTVLPLVDKVYTIDLPNKERTLRAIELGRTARKYCENVVVAGELEMAISKALLEADDEDVILAFGSLSYLGEVIEYMNNNKQIKTVDHEKIKEAVKLLLEGIGEDVNREGLLETPDRVARMYEEIYGGMYQDAKEHLSKVFHTEDNEMVVEKDITFYSTCEHHLLPFYGKAHIAYIPNGKVVGLSKLARTVEVYARRPQIQEQLTAQIADALMEHLEPKGVMVMIEAEHMCMTMRGIKKPGSQTVTIVKRGEFQDNEQLTNMFFHMVRS